MTNDADRTSDYDLIVTVRVYGPGSAEDAARALRDHRSTFDLPRDAEVEILDARPAPGPEAIEAACCDLHGRNCEPPSELCCEGCSEAAHPRHAPGVPCVMETA
jgi:hypothetical protein